MIDVNIKLLKIKASTSNHNEAFFQATVFIGNNTGEPILQTVNGYGFRIRTPDGKTIDTEPENPNLIGAYLLQPGQDVTNNYIYKACSDRDEFIPGQEFTLIALGPDSENADMMTFKFQQTYLNK